MMMTNTTKMSLYLQMSTPAREAGNGLRPVHFDHEAQLPVRLNSKAWQLLAHALRTPEKGDSDVFFSVRDAHPDGGLVAEGFCNLESILEAGKDLPDGTPVEVVDLSGRVVADLFVGVHALLLMQAVRKQIEQQGGRVAASPPLRAGGISVNVGGLTWASSFSQERIRSVAVEIDLMGLRPTDRSDSLLKRRKLFFDFTSAIELQAGSKEWARVARALQTASKQDSAVTVTLLDTSGRSALVLAEATIVLEQMLQRGKDKQGEPLQLVGVKGNLVAEIAVSVICVETLKLVQHGSPTSSLGAARPIASPPRSPSRGGVSAGLGSADTIALSIGRLAWRGKPPLNVSRIQVDADVMGLTESLVKSCTKIPI
jgi:hypothetical protein